MSIKVLVILHGYFESIEPMKAMPIVGQKIRLDIPDVEPAKYRVTEMEILSEKTPYAIDHEVVAYVYVEKIYNYQIV